MIDSALRSFEDFARWDMTARGFRHVLTHHPAHQDAAVLMFGDGPVPLLGPYHVVVVAVTGLELMQNAGHLRDLARARVAEAVRAYRQERAA